MTSEDNFLSTYCNDLYRWAKSWVIDDGDLEYGEQLVEEFKPFILFLVSKNLTKKTIKKHCDNLWLLGGELISDINRDESLRKVNAAKYIADSVDEEGGPFSSHLDTENEQKSFDSTCRKLHKFLLSSK